MRAQISASILAGVVAITACTIPAEAHNLGIHTVSVNGIIGEDTGTYPLGIVCDDNILIYGMSLSVPYNDHTDRYALYADSIRLGDNTIPHGPFTSGNDHVRIGLTEGFGVVDVPYPILLAPYTPLVIPIQVLDSEKGNPATPTLDITYTGSGNTGCSATELRGAQKVGLIIPIENDTSGVGETVLSATQAAIDDYNGYLSSADAGWHLELVIKDDMGMPEQSRERVQELYDEGVYAILGVVDDASLSAISDHIRIHRMVIVSCCSSDASLAMPDRIFRTIPDHTDQAKALAAMMHDAQIHVAITVHADDPHSASINEAIRYEMESRGGIVGATIQYPVNRVAYDYGIAAAQLDKEVKAFGDVNGAEHVAVVAISPLGVIDLILASLSHNTLDDHRWYASEAIVGMPDITKGELGKFVRATGLSGPTSHQTSDANSMFWHSAYNAAMIISEAISATQSQDTNDIIQAIPQVSARTYGMLNENGDLESSNYDIWMVTENGWEIVGRYLHHIDTILEG